MFRDRLINQSDRDLFNVFTWVMEVVVGLPLDVDKQIRVRHVQVHSCFVRTVDGFTRLVLSGFVEMSVLPTRIPWRRTVIWICALFCCVRCIRLYYLVVRLGDRRLR